ncbi:MAG: hypothetical protein M9894_18425 [Planctomycetes bacterium]|nr:hypothetical protein [Planctomycetota bacterium]
MSEDIVHPSPVRAGRLVLGCWVWLAMALVIAVIAWAIDDVVVGLAAGGVALYGVFLGAYRREVVVSPAARVVRTTGGLYPLVRRREHPFEDFEAVVIRGERHVSREYSRTTHETHRTRVHRFHAVALAGRVEVPLDATRDEAVALAWAEEVAAAMGLPVRRVAPAPPAPADAQLQARIGRLVTWGAVLIGLAMAAGTAFSIYRAATLQPPLDDAPPPRLEAEDDR